MGKQTALHGHLPDGDFGLISKAGPQVTITEITDMNLFQLSAFARQMDDCAAFMKKQFGITGLPALSSSIRGTAALVMRAEPTKFWIASRQPVRASLLANGAMYYPTDMTGSKAVIRVSGPAACAVLNRMCALDLTARDGAFWATGMHHVPVHVYGRHNAVFDVMIPRSFGLSIAHSLCQTSQQFGLRVTTPTRWTLPRL